MEVGPVLHAGLTIRVADVYHYPTRIVRHRAIRESEVHSFSVDHVERWKDSPAHPIIWECLVRQVACTRSR
ncbi:unnamed protein product [Urochloa humidicola]